MQRKQASCDQQAFFSGRACMRASSNTLEPGGFNVGTSTPPRFSRMGARIGFGVWDFPQTQVAVWEVYLAIPTVYKAASKQQPAEILRAITIPQMDTLRLVPGAGRWKGMPRLPAVRSGLNYSLFPSFGNPSLGIWTGFLVCDSIYHPTGFKRRRCHGGESE